MISGSIPIVSGVAGPAVSLTWVPGRSELWFGLGVGFSIGRTASAGALIGNNPSAVAKGLSYTIGDQWSPTVGGQAVINSSGKLFGPSVGVVGASASATWGACIPW
jgi:hypothetical protein